MKPFIIVADLCTGSMLLSRSLDQHPQVRCYGELFHPDDLSDNRPVGCDPRRANAREMMAAAFDAPGFEAAGFHVVISLSSPPQRRWADAWDRLRDWPDLRVIYLRQRDRSAQYASMLSAQQTGAYHPYEGGPRGRAKKLAGISFDRRIRR